ncbi:unnamed protein product, partial [Brenthis ino]
MMKIKILIFIILYDYFNKCSCYSKIGESCQIETIVGTCKPFTDCPYAIRLVNEDKELPPTCFWQGNYVIVCCPESHKDLILPGTLEISRLFRSSRVKKTNDMTPAVLPQDGPYETTPSTEYVQFKSETTAIRGPPLSPCKII